VKVYKEINSQAKLYRIDALEIAKKAGGLITKNVVMLGALSAIDVLPFKSDILLKTITNNVPNKFRNMNQKAFKNGIKAIKII
jgi:indolepyruvate ferredoxin oxidoreductase beta subunit